MRITGFFPKTPEPLLSGRRHGQRLLSRQCEDRGLVRLRVTGYWPPDRKAVCLFLRPFPVAYSIAPYASVQKSVNTFGDSGESIMRCVKRMPIVLSAGSVYADVPKPPSQPNRPGGRKISLRWMSHAIPA